MKKLLFLLVFIPLVFACNSDESLPYANIYTEGEIEVYIDNSNIEEFDLEIIYDNYIDTVGLETNKPKIIKFDTLFFIVNKFGVDKKVNNRNNFIRIYPDNSVKIIIKKDYKIIDSFKVDIPEFSYTRTLKRRIKKLETEGELWAKRYNKSLDEAEREKLFIITSDLFREKDSLGNLIVPNRPYHNEKANSQYVLNPLSLSTYQIDTIIYGGIFPSKSHSIKRYKRSFFPVNIIDWWFESPPRNLNYEKSPIDLLTNQNIKYELDKILGIKTIAIRKIN